MQAVNAGNLIFAFDLVQTAGSNLKRRLTALFRNVQTRASAKFQRHDCATHQPVASLDPDTFIARAKGLVMRGFKPEDAAEIVSREIMFENHDDPDIARKVQIEVNDFLAD